MQNDALLDALRTRFPAAEGDIRHELHDFLHEFGSVQSALLYAVLYAPTLCELDGSVLLSLAGSDVCERFSDKKKEWKGALADLEASFNMVEVPYLFSDRSSTTAEDALLAEFGVRTHNQ